MFSLVLFSLGAFVIVESPVRVEHKLIESSHFRAKKERQ
jgi:hypothetical protein